MALPLIIAAIIITVCVLLNNASNRIGMPMLLAFIVFGIICGNNPIFPFKFENFSAAADIATVALIFIMFYGGFGTRWKSAKEVAVLSGLLAAFGTIATAAFTGLFCHFVLKWNWIEAMLMGSVISSTDAASVFSILRSKKLGLKNHTAPLLEIESGSNDPFSYMLTIVMLSMLNGEVAGGQVAWMLFAQIAFGACLGVIIAKVCVFVFNKVNFGASGFDSLFLFAIALFSYAIPDAIGGNGYLSAYLAGIIIGNSDIPGKKSLVGFFDGMTSLMQVLIFFMLGLLARPAMMHQVILPAVGIFLFLLFIGRPLAVGLVMTPFKRFNNFKQQTCVSFVGLRGAASIVFAIFATANTNVLGNDILNIVFCIVLLSISLQGSLLPFVAKKLDMIDKNADVMTTFTDFSEESDLSFSELPIGSDNPWKDMKVKDIIKPKNMLFCLLIHPDGRSSVPKGDTILSEGDKIIMCSKTYTGEKTLKLIEHDISESDKLSGQKIKEIDTSRGQIVLVRRQNKDIIPNGDTTLKPGDKLFINIGKY